MPRSIPLDELLAMRDVPLGTTDWLEVSQDRIDQFADVTEDHAFIHVDVERASATPLGGTIAHGFLTLSLMPKLSESLMVAPEGVQMAINYGLNKVRFVQPVLAGRRVRLHLQLDEVREKEPGRILVASTGTLEVEAEEKPAYVAQMLVLFIVG